MISNLVKGGQELITKNAPVILTGVGVVGTVTTAVLTGKASIKAFQIIAEEKIEVSTEPDEELEIKIKDPLGPWETVKLVGPVFIPPIATGALTIAAIIMANRISASRAAALAAAYGITHRELEEYREKVKEKLGVTKDTQVRDAVAQDRVDKDPPPEPSQIIITGGGDVLCKDLFTGRYFHSTAERIKQAELSLNNEIINRMFASLRFFYDELGLEPTDSADILGWRNGDMPTVKITAVTTRDNRPCLAFGFDMMPYPDYDSGHSYS